jgi:hypothetical protein
MWQNTERVRQLTHHLSFSKTLTKSGICSMAIAMEGCNSQYTMNEHISFGNLPNITELFSKRTQHLKERLYNLRIDDVESEERFGETIAFLREAILPQPVVFGDHIFSGSLGQTEASLVTRFKDKLNQAMIRQVTLPFSGSRELFGYSTKNTYLANDAAILVPANGYLTVKLHTIFFSKFEALNAAKHLLAATLQMISMNNEALRVWSLETEDIIGRKLLAFRRECLELYRPNELLRPNTNT